MDREGLDLRPFRKRVRVVRAWRGLAVGLLVGGSGALVWSVLDVFGVLLSEWAWLGALAGAVALVGAGVGFLLPVTDRDVARSLDRRAGLQDRVDTFLERRAENEGFDEAQRQDTREHVTGLRARQVFPVRFGRWQTVAVSMVALASLVFLLGNTWYVLSPEARKAKEELEKIAAQIERVVKPVIEKKEGLTAEEKALANQMQEFARRLEKGKMNKEQAMQRANELMKQAQKLTQDRLQESMKKSQTAREQLSRGKLGDKGLDKQMLDQLNLDAKQRETLDQLKSELKMTPSSGDNKFDQATMQQMGLQDMDPTLLNLTPEQRDAIRKLLEQKLNDIERKLQDPQSLSQEELEQLLEQQKQLEQLQKQLQISEEARKVLEEFMNSPEFKEIMKAAQQMQKDAQQVSDGEPLSDEQIKELEKMLEELAEKLKDSKYREEVLQAMRDALEQLKNGNLTAGQGMGVGAGFGLGFGMGMGMGQGMGMGMGMGAGQSGMSMGGVRSFGSGGKSKDMFFSGQGGINRSDQEQQGAGDTNLLGIRGSRRATGEEWFIEVKAPSGLGDRTSVPYLQILPKYKDAAEKAIQREDIPKEHEKRVRQYFESLNRGKQ